MTLLPLPFIGLPPIKLHKDDDEDDDDDDDDSPPPLLPPIMIHGSSSMSSLSSPSSPESKKGSIESLLNSCSELRALDRKRRHAPYDRRQMKGLRLFSKQVCDKVAEKGITTYNEVADELTAAIHVDQKNIRRRVYDALNVFMALDIIAKDKKQIRWLGMNRDQQLIREIQQEEHRQRALLASIQQSQQALDETLLHYTHIHQLITRNQQQRNNNEALMYLPFFMITSDQPIETHSQSYETCTFHLSSNWSIYQDIDILNKLWPHYT